MSERKMNFIKVLFVLLLISACSSQEIKPTLRSIDKISNQQNIERQTNTIKSQEDIRRAYKRYLSTTPKTDKSRQIALTRLAELEFDVSNKLSLEQDQLKQDSGQQNELDRYSQQIKKSIELYSISLRDYPKAKGNDKILYQLAKAYDQIGDSENSFKTLLQLSTRYPNSYYYIETQFRIAEYYFSQANYIAAENAYTEVIISPKNHIFFERALFKRGWSRFKQAFYEEAIDDYLRAVTYHKFDDIEKLNKSEKERFNEYFRAIGLSFSNLGGASFLHEFFENQSDYIYLYHTYSVISDIYLKQERYSDSVNVLDEFISRYPNSQNLPEAQLKIVSAWQKGGFSANLFNSVELLYQKYNLNAQYWKNNQGSDVKRLIAKSLKSYILLMSEHFHARYQKSGSDEYYLSAAKWYSRYLTDYDAYARKDKVYFKYAELLRERKENKKALDYYELAAYDEELILDKKSSYLTIILTDILYRNQAASQKYQYLEKHIKYAMLFSALYPEDERISKIIAYASELAYADKKYEETVRLANLLGEKVEPNTESNNNTYKINTLKAQSYFKLTQYSAAESAYSSLLGSPELTPKDKKEFTDRIALSIYRQAINFQSQQMNDEAIHHFMRISDIAKSSDIAATGMYDAIALLINDKSWEQSVNAIKRFQTFFPKHKYNQDLTKKLSIAYLNSDQKLKAAEQFEKISSFEKSRDVKMTALWQAAELYESKNNHVSAVRSYTKYANTYKKPYAQNMEAMFKLVDLYSRSNSTKLKNIWQNRILNADKNSAKKDKTNRTNYISSITALQMARQKYNEFTNFKLTAPLKKNLKRKKKAMQLAVQLYGRASAYGISETTTESTFAIARIYQDFSLALLNSERPNNLKGEELEQYNILLEDQAYPFEDKAIEFYEINLSRIKNSIFDDWVSKSLTELKSLFPVKYARKSKIDGYIETLH